MSADDNMRDVFTSILISSASKENLELMISKITELKKKCVNKDKKIREVNSKVQPQPQSQKIAQKRVA